jgi:hypothetical protein
MRTSFAAASILGLAHADSRNMFAPAPAYNPAMVQAAAAYSPAVAPLDPSALTYVQPVEYEYPAEETEGSALFYATGALLVGAVAVVTARGQEKSVAEPDLEAATSAVRVAMLFSSGRSSGKKAAKGKKPAAKSGGFFGGGGAKKTPSRSAPAVDDSDLFVHEGTKGFQGDEAAFVYRQGLA